VRDEWFASRFDGVRLTRWLRPLGIFDRNDPFFKFVKVEERRIKGKLEYAREREREREREVRETSRKTEEQSEVARVQSFWGPLFASSLWTMQERETVIRFF
jgi:hypothetical protein